MTSDSIDAARVSRDWLEPRSFACKKCGFTAATRRIVEQHLLQNHPDLFADGPASATPCPRASEGMTAPFYPPPRVRDTRPSPCPP